MYEESQKLNHRLHIILFFWAINQNQNNPRVLDKHANIFSLSSQWRHNGRDSVSNHHPTIVYSTVCSGADQTKHQSSASLAFMRGIHRWPVNFPHKWQVTQKMLPFDDVIMIHCHRQSSVAIVRLWSLIDNFALAFPVFKIHWSPKEMADLFSLNDNVMHSFSLCDLRYKIVISCKSYLNQTVNECFISWFHLLQNPWSGRQHGPIGDPAIFYQRCTLFGFYKKKNRYKGGLN